MELTLNNTRYKSKIKSNVKKILLEIFNLKLSGGIPTRSKAVQILERTL